MSKLPCEAAECRLELVSNALVWAVHKAAQHEILGIFIQIEVIEKLVFMEEAANHQAESVLYDQFIFKYHFLTLAQDLGNQTHDLMKKGLVINVCNNMLAYRAL